MKKLILALGLLLAATVPALADPGARGAALSPKEEEALRLAGDWAERPIKPIQTADGKVVYIHGATMPTIIGSPMRICDIELAPGETPNEILVGDSTRWLVESGLSGNGVAHIFVKPLDSGLESSLVVTTNKRVYHMKLLSRDGEYPECPASFVNDNGKPGARLEKKEPTPLSDHKCADCGKPLRHLAKEGPDGYDYWACSGRPDCKASYDNTDGQPGQKRQPKGVAASEFKCPKCGRPLYRRQGVSKAGKQYDFFGCADRSCNASFQSEDGKPNFEGSRAKS